MPNSKYSFLVGVTTDSRERIIDNFGFGGGWGWRPIPGGILGQCVGGLEW